MLKPNLLVSNNLNLIIESDGGLKGTSEYVYWKPGGSPYAALAGHFKSTELRAIADHMDRMKVRGK